MEKKATLKKHVGIEIKIETKMNRKGLLTLKTSDLVAVVAGSTR